MAQHILLPNTYRDLDVMQSCLFTGVPVVKRDGEHVIPDWMQRQYNLSRQRVEMGQADRLARIMEFRAPADSVANQEFGKIEDRIKRKLATLDELHLWSKKLSVGMIWNHWRMAQNIHHPHAPDGFDTRHLPIVLMDFHEEFAAFRANTYQRTGSTLVLPTKMSGGWLVHAFGAFLDQSYSDTHDAILPYAFIAASHDEQLIVSTLYDSNRKMESGRLTQEWHSSGLHEASDSVRVCAGLAVIFAELAASGFKEIFGGDAPQELLLYIAYQMGVIVEVDGTSWKYRKRLPTDPVPPPIITS